MSNAYPEVEMQEGTRIERVLLVALVAFLLVGGYWALDRIESRFPEPQLESFSQTDVHDRPENTATSVEDELGVPPIEARVAKLQAAYDNRNAAITKFRTAEQKQRTTYEFRREEYRTAMEAHNPANSQRDAFAKARAAYQDAAAKVVPAQRVVDGALKELRAGQKALNAAKERARDIYNARVQDRNVKLFGYHFSFAGACLGISWLLWQAGRARRWRYQTILTAMFTASVIQLLFLLFRYCWGIFVEEYAVLGVSVLGTTICILAIIAIKRWLFSPERISEARLAARCCPMCSTPFVESQTHCWHCGHQLTDTCPVCGSSKLRHTPHCGHCGSATAIASAKKPSTTAVPQS
jgi:hypothetical protein